MRVIIAGSRTFTNGAVVAAAYHKSGFKATEIVSGGCRGVDESGERLADQMRIPVRRFQASWATYGKSAGPVRNREMAAYADALIAIWDGKSRGTANMIAEAKAKGLKIYIEDPRRAG